MSEPSAQTSSLIVGLPVDFVPEGDLSSQQVAAQRAEIARQRGALQRELRGTGTRTVAELKTVPFVALELTEEGVQALRDSGRAASLEPNELAEPWLADSGPLIQADQLNHAGYTGQGRLVAVLDTGVDTAHPFFGGRVVEEACYSTTETSGPSGGRSSSLCPDGVQESTAPGSGEACEGIAGRDHGTHVAGIAAGSGASLSEVDFSGVAPGADLMAVQVFSEYDCDGDARKTAIDNLRSLDVATVIAAGNNGWSDAVSAPGCISTAVTVGSTTKVDTVSWFSNSHPSLVDLYAPGSAITSAVLGGNYGTKNGTSMAAPQVAGTWAALRQARPDANVTSLLDDLQTSGLTVTDTRSSDPSLHHSHPRIRVEDARTQEPSLLVNTTGTGQGTVTSDPAGIECEPDCDFAFATGTEVTLTATPASDHDFAGWDGADCSGTGACTLTMPDATVTVAAEFVAPPLANDDADGATEIAALPDSRTQSTVEATLGADEPIPACDSTTGATVWFRHTAGYDATLTADTLGSDFDTVLQIYHLGADGQLAPVGCDFGTADASFYDATVAFPADAGETYYLQIGGYEGTSGNLTLNLAADNHPPQAEDDHLQTTRNVAGSVDVLANDTDPDGGPLTVQSFTQATAGAVDCEPGGLCTYTPGLDVVGHDEFTYTVADDQGATDQATVTVEVCGANEHTAAVALDDDDANVDGLLCNGASYYQVDVGVGDTITADLLHDAGQGELDLALSIVEAGEETVLADTTGDPRGGTKQLVHVANDSGTHFLSVRGEETNSYSLALEVEPAPPGPVAVADELITTKDTPGTLNVLDNDEGEGPSVTDWQSPSDEGGQVDCTAAGECTYTPPTDFTGEDAFTYTITDEHGRTDWGIGFGGGPGAV